MLDFLNSETGQAVFTAVVLPLMTAVGGFLIAYLKKKINELASKIENEKLRKYTEEANAAVLQAVEYLMQTYVDTLKKEGAFDEAAQNKAFGEAKRVALLLISENAKEALGAVYSDFDTWLDTKIEQMVRQAK